MTNAEPTAAAENAAAAAIRAALLFNPHELLLTPTSLTDAGALARALVRQLNAGSVEQYYSPARGGCCVSVAGVPDGEPAGHFVEIVVLLCPAETMPGALRMESEG